MKILLTGSTGFIGRRLLAGLVASGHQVYPVVRGAYENLASAEVISWDMEKQSIPYGLPKRIDAVAHLALPQDFRRFPESVNGLYAVNVTATMALLEYAMKADASRFFLATTGNSIAPDPGLEVGETPTPPNDFYTASKLAGEMLVRPFRSCFPVHVGRMFFPYGAGQQGRVIWRLIEQIKLGKPVKLEQGLDGNGSVLSLTNVDDMAGAIQSSIENSWNGVFDLAAPERLSIRDIALEIGRQTRKTVTFETGTEPAKKMVADLSMLKKYYKMDQFRLFSKGLADMLSLS